MQNGDSLDSAKVINVAPHHAKFYANGFKESGGGSIELLSGRKFEICLGEFKEGKDIHPFCAIRFAFCGKESLGMYALHDRLAPLRRTRRKMRALPGVLPGARIGEASFGLEKKTKLIAAPEEAAN